MPASFVPVDQSEPEPGPEPLPDAGVSASTWRQPGDTAPRVSMVTNEGVLLEYPVWLDLWPERKAAMLEEIRTTAPDADPRVSADLRGVPAGTTLIVLDPGPYYAAYSPTGLAAGEFRPPSTIYVAWRGHSSGKLLPALGHELLHMVTGDPNAGH